MQNLTKEWKQPPVVILQQANFYNIFILCLWLRIIRRSDQGVQFINFPSQIFFNDINHGQKASLLKKNYLWLLPFYMAVASYCHYENVRSTMRTAIVFVSYLQLYRIFILFQLQSRIILGMRTKLLLKNIRTKRVIMKITMMEIFNNYIAGRLNNNYFPLNESSSLY